MKITEGAMPSSARGFILMCFTYRAYAKAERSVPFSEGKKHLFETCLLIIVTKFHFDILG